MTRERRNQPIRELEMDGLNRNKYQAKSYMLSKELAANDRRKGEDNVSAAKDRTQPTII